MPGLFQVLWSLFLRPQMVISMHRFSPTSMFVVPYVFVKLLPGKLSERKIWAREKCPEENKESLDFMS